MEQTTFKVGDLLIWTETAWSKHVYYRDNTRKGFTYSMPPAGFYKITWANEEAFTVQSTENPKYEQCYTARNFANNFQLVSEKYQENSELISALDIVGLL
jgi:hypothetical protein